MREDLVMQAISYYRAIQTQCWTSLGTISQPRCEFDEDGILNCLERLAHFMRQWEIVFSLLDIRPIRLSYEELESDARSVVSCVMRLLDIEKQPEPIPLISCCDKQRNDESAGWAARIRAAVR
jgi:LPS sulfotransferase NodH